MVATGDFGLPAFRREQLPPESADVRRSQQKGTVT